MARQVLFIHGGGGGAYEEDLKLAASLRDRLGADYAVQYPQMPDEEDPDYEVWKQTIADELAAMAVDGILVGHSIGASVIIRAVVDGIGQPIAGVFLVATPFWHDHEIWRWTEVELPDDAAERLPRGVPVFFYHGSQDEIAPVSHLDMYARVFPQATVRRLDGRNHQLNDDLAEVAQDILGLN